VRHFVDHIKGRNPENLLGGATTEQISTLVRVTKKGVDENICVNEQVSAGRKVCDPLRRA
jgi:hypothetical protein